MYDSRVFSRSFALSACCSNSSPNGDRTSDWVFVCTVHAQQPGQCSVPHDNYSAAVVHNPCNASALACGKLHSADTQHTHPITNQPSSSEDRVITLLGGSRNIEAAPDISLQHQHEEVNCCTTCSDCGGGLLCICAIISRTTIVTQHIFYFRF